MKAEELQKLRQAKIDTLQGIDGDDPIPMAPPATRSRPPVNMPEISVTTTPSNPGDVAATKQLLDRCWKEDHYQCIRCDFTTGSYDEMVYHLAEEIRQGLQSIADLYDPRVTARRWHQPNIPSETNNQP